VINDFFGQNIFLVKKKEKKEKKENNNEVWTLVQLGKTTEKEQ
jgi:hypothetical protein